MSSRANRPAHLHPLRRRHCATGAGALRPSRSRARLAAEVAGPLLLIGALAWPLLFTNATFANDWLNHLWYMWHQSLALRAKHHPSLFLDYSKGVYYPLYAFYGGTLYALTGALSLALGDAPLQAYVLTYLLGFAAAYGGWLWLARMFGLRSWPAHMPGLVFVTSASYLTTLYGLGDWPEFLAVSAMPLLIASALSVWRAPSLRAWPAIALAASSVVFFGSHLLTALWGATVLLLVALAAILCVPAARAAVTPARALRVAALVIPALLVSSWFLLPAIAYESQTVIAHSYPRFRELLRSTMFTVAARHLFTLSRTRASGTVLTLALPILAIAWVLGSLAISLATSRGGTWRRLLLVIAGATALLLVLMTHAGLILALPRVYATLQFSFRLESYVLLGVSGALLAALVLAGEGGPGIRRWRLLLAPIAVLSLLGALQQVGAYTPRASRSGALSSASSPPTAEQEGLLDYVDDRLPTLRRPLPRLDFPPSTAGGTSTATLARVPTPVHARRLVDTNIRSGPDLVHIDGARIVGTDSQADDVLEIAAGSSTRRAPTVVTVAPAAGAVLYAGRILAILACIVLAGELGLIVLRRSRRQRVGTRESA